MFRLSNFISLIAIVSVLYLVWTYIFYPLFIDAFIDGISASVNDIDEDFSLLYVVKRVVRYLFWTIITVGWAFFAGPIIIKMFDYIIFDLLFQAIKNFIGIS